VPVQLADGERFDPTAISQGKHGCDKEGEAKAEAFSTNLPPDLAALVAAWAMLPDPLKAGIMAMVQAVLRDY
jgi:hypothetical protein